MTTQTEALKLALEALKTERDIYREHDEDGAPEYILDAIAALEALAQPEQEPVALNKKIKTLIEEGCSQVSIAMQLGGAVGSSSYNKMYQNLEKYFEEKDEPVAWGFENTAITGCNRWMMLREEIPANDQYGGALWTPLYTTPPQRTWVGLTDEDYQILREGVVKQGKPLHWMIEHIETKLKEKNT